jgi:rod shape-determining protein MreD
VVLWAWFGLACLLAQAVGWAITALVSGTPPSLAAAGLQWLATVLLFPVAGQLIERFRDADVRFR